MQSAVRIFGVVLLTILLVGGLQAQTAAGVLHGQVTDPTGAVVTQATVTVTGPNGLKMTVQTNARGAYEVKGLAAGKYNMHVVAKGFAAYDLADVSVVPGDTPALDISLDVAVEQQQVTVEGEAKSVSTDADSNASATIIKGEDLDALSDDPDELQSDLDALAGPSAGPNGGQIYIDGFSNGTLPPKSSIREIRVNQNPFSAQYDRLGFGRVEVFTKPGKDTYHGQFMTMVNHRIFNSRNPYLTADTVIPDYHTAMYNGNFGGPINSKSSFFMSFRRRDISDVSITSHAWLPCAGFDVTQQQCATFAPVNFDQAYPNPNINTEISPRIDYQLSSNNTLTARYEYERGNRHNLGLGQYSLPSQLNVDMRGTEHNLQISDTQVINSSMVNETRFQFVRENDGQIDLSAGAQGQLSAISLVDGFAAGSGMGNSKSIQNHYEFQNYTSKVHGTHFIRFGGRVRVNTDDEFSAPNKFGTFSYSSRTAFYIVNNMTQPSSAIPWTTLTDRRTACLNYLNGGRDPNDPFVSGWPTTVDRPMAATDCGIAQFTQTSGNASASVSQTDAGLYAEDDWRIRPSFTLSYGLRFETQNNVNNRANVAPRIGIAWGLGRNGKVPKTVLRSGFGMFYDRFSQGNVLRVTRTNGTDPQRNCKVLNVDTLDATGLCTSAAAPIPYAINPDLKVPYTMQVATTIEHQLTRDVKLTASYVASRGLHQLVMENIITPIAGTQDVTQTYRYDSAGTFKQNQLMVNGTFNRGRLFSLMGWYVYGHANSNTQGANSFPTVPFDLQEDWGRSAWDTRHRGMIMGTINLPRGFRLNPMINFSSGRPYDLYGFLADSPDLILNKRPWFSNGCSGTSVGGSTYDTTLGCFSMDPASASNLGRVPVNYGRGPSSFSTNLRVSKTFGFGKKAERTANAAGGPPPGGGGGRGPGGPGGFGGGGHDHGPMGGGGMMGGGGSSGQRYSLTFSASARNLFNNVNPGQPVGNLSSPYFAQSTNLVSGFGQGASANRRIDLQVQFSF